MHVPVDKEFNDMNLIYLAEKMNQQEIQYTVAFGTLLGFQRDGGVIDGDDDIDIWVNSKFYPQIIQILKEGDYQIAFDTPPVFVQGIKVINGIQTFSDIYFYIDKNDVLIDKWNFTGNFKNVNSHIHIPKDLVFPLKSKEYGGINIKIPNDGSKVCEFLYGSRYLEKLSKRKKEYITHIINNKPKTIYMIPSFKVVESDKVNIKPTKVWDHIYIKSKITDNASTFSKFVIEYIENGKTLLDLGCGNARDSSFFNKNGLIVSALDGSEVIIEKNKSNYPDINFICMDIKNINSHKDKYNYVYTRFFLHSISKVLCTNLINHVYKILESGGLFFIECRSVNDPLCGTGIPGKNNNEWINHHYRRFIIKDELLQELINIGFSIKLEMEGNNLSVYRDDNPFLIRIICYKE